MKRFFYAKIALTNLKKNRQNYFPYLLTCIATIMMFYIMAVEALHRDIGDTLAAFLQQGHPLLHGEQWVLCTVDEHGHDQVIVDLCRALDDIEMTSCDRIERPGVNCSCHRFCPPCAPLKSALVLT